MAVGVGVGLLGARWAWRGRYPFRPDHGILHLHGPDERAPQAPRTAEGLRDQLGDSLRVVSEVHHQLQRDLQRLQSKPRECFSTPRLFSFIVFISSSGQGMRGLNSYL